MSKSWMESDPGLHVYNMSFDGKVLKRGFWLYIWKIISSTSKKEYLYIGRTGDSSSHNAASPFNRIGQHLNFSKNAKGNSIAKHLCEAGVDPLDCKYEMFAIGPVFPEKSSMEEHCPVRDEVAALELALSREMKKRNYTVLGTHNSKKPLNEKLFQKIITRIDKDFPSNLDGQTPK